MWGNLSDPTEKPQKNHFFLDDVTSQFVQMYLFLNTSVLDKRKGIPKNLYFYTYFFEKKWQIKFQKVGNLKNGGKTQMANITKWWKLKKWREIQKRREIWMCGWRPLAGKRSSCRCCWTSGWCRRRRRAGRSSPLRMWSSGGPRPSSTSTTASVQQLYPWRLLEHD